MELDQVSCDNLGETGAHWDKNQSSHPGPKNVNLTTSDTWLWKSLTCCPCYVSTCTLLCKHGWCENLLKYVSQLSQYAPYLGHIGTIMLVKENKCKMGGKYIFWTRRKQRIWGSQPVKWTLNNTVKIIFGWNEKIWIWNVKRCYQYHYHIVGHIGTMSHCAPKKLSQSAPPAPEKVIREKCQQKIMWGLRILHMAMPT